MGKRISEWLSKISKGWVALSALVLFLLFSALALPKQAAESELEIGDAGSPDMSFFYSPSELYEMAEAYGEEGRAAYIKARFTFDLVWPLVYLLFLSTAISWINKKSFREGSWWQGVNLVPLLGATFDYLENVATSVVMWRYPGQTAVVVLLAPVFTMVKWVFVGGSFSLLGIGIAAGVWQWAKGRRR